MNETAALMTMANLVKNAGPVNQRQLQNAEKIFFHISTMVKRGLIEVLKDELSNADFADVLQEACETALEIIREKQKAETAAEECPPAG